MRAVPAWLPNAISYLRIALVPAWVALAETANRAAEQGQPAESQRHGALAVLVAIGLSDVVDGFLARRFGLQTRLGATLDAVADKLAQVVLFTYLALRTGPAFAPIPIWFLGLLVARDVVLLVGCLLVRWRTGALHVEHRAHGKASSLLLFLLLLVFSAGFGGRATSSLLVGVACLVATSTVLYVRDGVQQCSVAR